MYTTRLRCQAKTPPKWGPRVQFTAPWPRSFRPPPGAGATPPPAQRKWDSRPRLSFAANSRHPAAVLGARAAGPPPSPALTPPSPRPRPRRCAGGHAGRAVIVTSLVTKFPASRTDSKRLAEMLPAKMSVPCRCNFAIAGRPSVTLGRPVSAIRVTVHIGRPGAPAGPGRETGWSGRHQGCWRRPPPRPARCLKTRAIVPGARRRRHARHCPGRPRYQCGRSGANRYTRSRRAPNSASTAPSRSVRKMWAPAAARWRSTERSGRP